MRATVLAILAFSFGLLLAVLLAESLLWLLGFEVTLPAGGELNQFRDKGTRIHDAWVVDEKMGFLPRMGYRPAEGRTVYSENGTLPNPYPLKKSPARQRILLVGDSVIARGTVVKALQEAYANSSLEFWNAGVESFNTRQEVDFYKRFNSKIEPDHVVLTFHLNDFQVTPVTFVDDTDALIAYSPNQSLVRVNRLLFGASRLYRLFISFLLSPGVDMAEGSKEVQQALHELKSLLPQKLTVVVFPFLKPWNQWTAEDRSSHSEILRILGEEQIRYFDLLPLLLSELDAGRSVRDAPQDLWHPNQEFADAIADFLKSQGLLIE